MNHTIRIKYEIEWMVRNKNNNRELKLAKIIPITIMGK